MGTQTPDDRKQDRARQLPEFLAVGRVVRPHGVRGGLLVERISDLIQGVNAGQIIFLGESRVRGTVRSLRPHRGQYLLQLDEFRTRDAVDGWRDWKLYLRFEETEPLPEGTYYHWQILGLDVVTEEGEALGSVAQILETGANDVYIVRSDAGEELLLPAIEEVVKLVDLEAGVIKVRLLPGLRTGGG